jgi:hypothetical protein
LEPLTIITTLQPFLVAWVMSIAFFVTLAVVAVISKGRRWYELACLFLLAFLTLSACGILSAHWLLDIQMVDLEFISLNGP